MYIISWLGETLGDFPLVAELRHIKGSSRQASSTLSYRSIECRIFWSHDSSSMGQKSLGNYSVYYST